MRGSGDRPTAAGERSVWLGVGVLTAVLFAVVVAIAVPPTAPQPVGHDEVTVEGGDLGVDAQARFQWTQQAVNRTATESPTITVESVDEADLAVGLQLGRFERLLLLEDPEREPTGGVLAYVDEPTSMTVNADRLAAVREGRSVRTLDELLVHEFLHVLQFQSDVLPGRPESAANTTDGEVAWLATVEGSADYLADQYDEDRSLAGRHRAIWTDRDTPTAHHLASWPYYRGMLAVDERVAGPDETWTVYEDPPETTVEVLRSGDSAGGEPARETDAAPTVSDREVVIGHDRYETTEQDRLGAWFVEVLLATTERPADAREVATGWQWDQRVDLKRASEDGSAGGEGTEEDDAGEGGDGADGSDGDQPTEHVWVTEWRSAAGADAFETALTDSFDRRFEATGEASTWTDDDHATLTVERTGTESVALLVGSESFVANASVSVDGDTYCVTEAGPNATAAAAAGAGRDTTTAGGAVAATAP